MSPDDIAEYERILQQFCFPHEARLSFDPLRLLWVIEHRYEGEAPQRYTIPREQLSSKIVWEMARAIHAGRPPDGE